MLLELHGGMWGTCTQSGDDLLYLIGRKVSNADGLRDLSTCKLLA